jgi:hypothetical protein
MKKGLFRARRVRPSRCSFSPVSRPHASLLSLSHLNAHSQQQVLLDVSALHGVPKEPSEPPPCLREAFQDWGAMLSPHDLDFGILNEMK